MLGTPFDGQLKLRSDLNAMIPHMDHVEYDPDISLEWLSARYNSDDYLFFQFPQSRRNRTTWI